MSSGTDGSNSLPLYQIGFASYFRTSQGTTSSTPCRPICNRLSLGIYHTMLVRSYKRKPPSDDGSVGIYSALSPSKFHIITFSIATHHLIVLPSVKFTKVGSTEDLISVLLPTLSCRSATCSQNEELVEFRIGGFQSSDPSADRKAGENIQRLETVKEKYTPADDFKKTQAAVKWDVTREKDEDSLTPYCRRPNETIALSWNRPGTAPALFTPARSSRYVEPNVVSRTSTAGSGISTATVPRTNGFTTGPASEIELMEDSPFAFNVPNDTDLWTTKHVPLSPPIKITNIRSEVPVATVWDVCGSWP